MIVSHESRSLFINADTAKKILDRFVPPIKIELPENMAFQLMAQAMKTTDDVVLKKEWEEYKEELNDDLASVRASIRDNIKKNAVLGHKTAISDAELQGIIPIHPYAALMLKHLSVAFNSNQRSMFDFIINNDTDSKAFKWFIANYGPLDTINLQTIDMLWDFFYGKGQNGLNDDVRVILDSYSLLNSEKLTPDEQRVLKTVLLFQAISMRVGDVELLKPNERNVDLAFNGTGWSKGKARSIAEKLVRDGLLFKKPVGGGKTEYTVANSTGDAATIRKKKEEVLKDTKTQDLIIRADLINALPLPAPIAGRFILEAAGPMNFTSVFSRVINRPVENRFKGLVTFAVNDHEETQLKNHILQSLRSGKTDLIYIDAGLTPMGQDLFDQYVENMAYSRYYAQNDKHRAGEFQSQASKCLQEWKDKVTAGAFMLYTKEYPSGMRLANLSALQYELSSINHKSYPYGLEQYNVIANMFSKGPIAQGAECGITQKLAGTFRSSNKNTSLDTALSGVWGVDNYWEDPAKKNLPIVRLKLRVEEIITDGFSRPSGRISMSLIYNELTKPPFGLMPNNISAFVLGFLLKEYAINDYFWSNGTNSETMTVEKMKNMIAAAINQEVSPNKSFREAFIVAMSADQRAFLNCTSTAFKIPASQCGSIENTRDQIRIAMKRFSFPIWSIKYVLPHLDHSSSDQQLAEIIDDYCSIANTANGSKGNESELATSIGQAILENPDITNDLSRILTNENCREGMLTYIDSFQGGILKQLAAKVEDNGAYIDEIRKKFNVDAANWVWSPETADDKIREVILDYQIIVESNKSLPKCISISDVIRGWDTKTNKVKISYESMKKSVGDLSSFLGVLYKIKRNNNIADNEKEKFYNLLLVQRESFDQLYQDQVNLFKIVAKSFLTELDDQDIANLYTSFPNGQFMKSKAEYFTFVEREVNEYLKGQLKKRIRDLWKEKTGTKDPVDWSSRYDTPILCMFNDEDRVEAKRIFEIMKYNSPSEIDANRVLRYLTYATFYEKLANEQERNRCFMDRVVGDYSIILKDPQSIRDYLSDHSTERPYDWMESTSIRNQIRAFADKQYKTGGYERAWSVIDEMEPGQLRIYLKDLISDNVKVGIEILKNK